MEHNDRKTVLKGELKIYLKEPTSYIDIEWKVCEVKKLCLKAAAIIEKEGQCFVAMPCNGYTLDGMLYETRDTFDELITAYEHTEITNV